MVNRGRIVRRVAWVAVAAALIGWAVLALRPKPILVEVAAIAEGPLEVTIAAEGKTRVRDRYVVATPVSGLLSRLRVREGDWVAAGQVIGQISPLPLDPLNPRQEGAAAARLRVAEAAVREANTRIEQEETALALATRERQRTAGLVSSGDLPRQALDEWRDRETAAAQSLTAVRARALAAAAEVDVARAALLSMTGRPAQGKETSLLLRAPIAGRVLTLHQESQRVLPAGTPILEISDPAYLELVIEVLSTDAVQVSPGARVIVDRWGGDQPLEATVRLLEPAAFTRVSALGIEEQRVNVIADLLPEERARAAPLGDAYRIEARIVLRETPRALLIPLSALFRRQEDWACYVVTNDSTLAERRLTLGDRGERYAIVQAGLQSGEKVLLHPRNDLSPGMLVAPLQP